MCGGVGAAQQLRILPELKEHHWNIFQQCTSFHCSVVRRMWTKYLGNV